MIPHDDNVTFYEVGGSVRDSILGIPNKDHDYAVECDSFATMEAYLEKHAFEIFLSKPEYLTIRARFPRYPVNINWRDDKGRQLVGDFVLCRKDGAYSDSRRPDDVMPGTILDDLARRDFTCNAIARNVETGEVIDPHNGTADLQLRTLRCVGSAMERLKEDPLRALRAFRFAITKRMRFDEALSACLFSDSLWLAYGLASVSTERIREELERCFAADTITTFGLLAATNEHFRFALFGDYDTDIRGGRVWLKPSLEKH